MSYYADCCDHHYYYHFPYQPCHLYLKGQRRAKLVKTASGLTCCEGAETDEPVFLPATKHYCLNSVDDSNDVDYMIDRFVQVALAMKVHLKGLVVSVVAVVVVVTVSIYQLLINLESGQQAIAAEMQRICDLDQYQNSTLQE